MVAAAVGERRAAADFYVAMLLLADCRVIRGMGHIHHQRDVGLERVGNLARAEKADFLHDVGHGQDFRISFFRSSLQLPQGLRHGEGADAIVKGARHRQVAAQHFKLVGQA